MTALTIVAFTFDTPGGSGQMLALARQLVTEASIRIEDAAEVVWLQGEERPRTRQVNDDTCGGVLGAAFWGMLFGLIFIVPCLGMAFGAALGALAGKFSTYGIDRRFAKSVSEKVTEGTSALFLMASSSVVDRVAEAARQKGWAFEIISTNLSTEQETQLQQDFGAA
ncbi:MAG: DUF1269 domain-containing protein [Halieaceae bacterium]|nr:DUF1269 domain-containing protein [Halieaceae bacterium]